MSDRNAVATARKISDAWLNTLDRGRLQDAWASASSYFRNRVSKAAWTDAIAHIRETKGRVLERRLLMSLERQHVPGMPKGPYIAFDFLSRFENVEAAVERVSMRMCEDGEWRLAGYSVY
jgi:hypothetical protein